MRALIQRVERAAVRVIDGSVGTTDSDAPRAVTVGEIGPGLCVFVGVTHDDDEASAGKLADKIWNLRVFDDDEGVMNRALSDGCGDVLVVSQFTLYGDTSKGRRPSWIAAARPDVAEPLVDAVVESLRAFGANVETGRFRTEMQVELVNDGPVTVSIET